METRIHGIITHGGEAVNVVPKYASARFSVRSASQQGVADVMAKMRKIAEGAALMTGCEFTFTEGELLFDKRPSYEIGRVYSEHMRAMGMEINAEAKRGMHSTDFGHISYKIPSVTGSFAISHEPIPGHSQQVVDASGSEYGYEQLIKVSKAMALTALDLLLDPELMDKAKDEQAHWSERYEGGVAR
jgi:metal-dependent amidase/aminoacylase/carboxypeptidase family protein